MIGQLGTVMSEEFFKFCVYYRDEKNCYNNAKVTPLVSAAMTYWVTHMSYLAIASVAGASYLKFGTETEERNKIKNVAINAKKTVNTVHYRMKQLNVVVENLDYRQLIKKYNGKKYQPYADKEYSETEGILAKSNKLWYFDPPYHPATISDYKDNEAPYEESMNISMVKEMVKILHGDMEKDYGPIEYFIKSDYDPKDIYERQKAAGENTSKVQPHIGDFDVLEDNIKCGGHEANIQNPVFYKLFVGEFNKGADDEFGNKVKGREYIWCRGNYIS